MKLTWQSSIDKLFKSKSSKTSEKLQSANINTLLDLIWVIPRRVTKVHAGLSEKATEDNVVKANVKVLSHQVSKGKLAQKRIPLNNISLTVQDIDSKVIIQLKWFNAYPSLTKKIIGFEHLSIFGKVTVFNGSMQMINPDFNGAKQPKSVLREYPTINTISGPKINNLIDKIPSILWDDIPSVVPGEIELQLTLSESFQLLHTSSDTCLRDHALNRLVYEEFFTEQIQLYQRKHSRITHQSSKIKIDFDSSITEFQTKIPFSLTGDQSAAIKDIIEDLQKNSPMMRLLQGDVGCGKTLIAFGAASCLMDQLKQVALMCPTEALSHQHYESARNIFNPLHVCLITSATKTKDKIEILSKIERGDFLLIIGTHSLIQSSMKFKNLSLSIIDEQHKFGVHQRIALSKKSTAPNTLLMTATPIPRSLCLTQFGDLEISIVKEKPLGRKKISSRIISRDKFHQFLNFISTRIDMGEQAYVVAPAIEESELHEIQNVEKIYQFFNRNFPKRKISYLHGKLNTIEKEQTLNNFYENKINILISTSVIEVGIDNPNATVMCIFGPERFGLSSLHQLRGRVGRGGKAGFFFMVEDKTLSKESLHRLKVIEQSSDGFFIAEEDLKIRGEGNITGTEQSGSAYRRISNLLIHKDILDNVINDFEKFSKKLNLFNSLQAKEEVIYTI
jgi:ATP-dependent DNA helicase RecG